MCIRDRVLDVADIQRIMGISRASAYELVHTPGFPAFRRDRLIKVKMCIRDRYLAREIVTRQGGYIKVVSEPGKGSEFSIMLPTK